MRILFDHDVPRPLGRHLPGHQVDTARQRGWEELGNGDLLNEELLFSQAAGNGFTARCLPSIDWERPKPPEDSPNSYQAALDTIADMRRMVLARRED